MAKRKRGIPEEEISGDGELAEILEALPENEMKVNFQAGFKYNLITGIIQITTLDS